MNNIDCFFNYNLYVTNKIYSFYRKNGQPPNEE